jgi:hypothetical protein
VSRERPSQLPWHTLSGTQLAERICRAYGEHLLDAIPFVPDASQVTGPSHQRLPRTGPGTGRDRMALSRGLHASACLNQRGDAHQSRGGKRDMGGGAPAPGGSPARADVCRRR